MPATPAYSVSDFQQPQQQDQYQASDFSAPAPKPVSSSPNGMPSTVPDKYAKFLQASSDAHGVPYDILRAMLFQESSDGRNTHNPSGATGVMQFLPSTAAGFGIDPNKPDQAIDGAARYLSGLHKEFGSWELALAGYNAGPGAVRAAGKKVPGTSETQNYVHDILANANIFRDNMTNTRARIKALTSQAVPESVRSGAKNPSQPQEPSSILGWVSKLIAQPFRNAATLATVYNNTPDSFGPKKAVKYALSEFGERAKEQAVGMIPTIGPTISAEMQLQRNPYTRKALDRLGEAFDVVGFGALNASARQVNEQLKGATPEQGVAQGFGQVGQIMSSSKSMGEKLDTLADNFGFNSSGELRYWAAQPGVRDIIQAASPQKGPGQLLQLFMGMHSDLARMKPDHPYVTGAETFVGQMFNPLNFIPVGGAAGRGVQMVSKVGKVLEEIPRVTEFVDRMTPAMQKVSGLFKDTFVTGDRYWRMRENAENPAEGEHAHSTMVRDQTSIRAHVQQLYTSPDLLGELPQDAQYELVHAIEHPEVTTNAPPEWNIPYANQTILQRRQNYYNLVRTMDEKMQDLAPETAQKLMNVVPPNPETLANVKNLYTNVYLPELKGSSTGAPFGQGGLFDVARSLAKTKPALTLADFSKEILNGATAQSNPRFAPHYSVWEHQVEMQKTKGVGVTGGAGQRMGHRSVPSVQQGVETGMSLNAGWSPASDFATWAETRMRYTTMLSHIKELGPTVITKAGDPATMPIAYHWPGDARLKGSALPDPENPDEFIDAGNPRSFGSGPDGYDAFKKFAQEGGLQAAFMKVHPNKLTPETAWASLLRRATNDFQETHPGHTAEAENILQSPDVRGYAVDHTFLESVIDSNPVFDRAARSLADPNMLEARMNALREVRNPNEKFNYTDFDPNRLMETHFAHLPDDNVSQTGAWLDYLNTVQRDSIITGYYYHPTVNVLPLALQTIAERAGNNPAKLAEYGSKIMAAYGVGLLHSLPSTAEMTRGLAMSRGIDLFGSDVMNKVFNKLTSTDIPESWMDAADKAKATSPVMGASFPTKMVARLLTVPYGDLPAGQQMMRSIVQGSQWNQDVVFGMFQNRIESALFHVLHDREGLSEAEASNTVRRRLGDPSNLTANERAASMRYWMFFYSWAKNGLKQGMNILAKAPKTVLAANRATATLNSVQEGGQSNVGTSQLDIGHVDSGAPVVMSNSFAPYRFASRMADMAFGIPLTGDTKASIGVGVDELTANLTPVPSLVVRGLAAREDIRNETGNTPQEFSRSGPMFDTQAPLGQQIKQFGQQLVEPFVPSIAHGLTGFDPAAPQTALSSMGPSTYVSNQAPNSPSLYGASRGLRDVMFAMPPEVKARASALIERLDNGDASAWAEAKALEKLYKYRRKSGGFGGFSKL